MASLNAVFAGDLVVGESYPIGSYLISREAILEFAGEWDPQPIHMDDEIAARGFYDGIIASGLHTLCIFQKLAVTHVYRDWEIIAGRGIRDLQFLRPVRPEMTLTGTVTITAIEPRDESRSLVHKFGELFNDAGELVFTMRAEAYMRVRIDPTG
ncbi:MaoC/PaaZ C-terminal domain-containing protein [Cryobacterium aureum]|uniref:MaoC/PaaZ C-terminal domain-containing protein n=1 Tax=Cryobacterium aureum TaxID=995037 RepID=UPI000CF49A61|nr:MaoC/PaaZ C-terminal domain-containing protein [Cryobacterium aureum]